MGRKYVALIVIIAYLGYTVGCTSMKTFPREEIPKLGEREKVWIKTDDGTEYIINEPWIQGDKLMGYVEGQGHQEIEISKIEAMKTEEFDATKSLVLTVVFAVGGVLLMSVMFRGLLSGTSGGSENEPGPGDNE